ncbi:MAG: hypothetical protein ACREH6_12065 [Geminicoccaceae bacterium]
MGRSSLLARSTPGIAGLLLATLASCATIADAIRPSPEETAIRRYYEMHASEEYGRCPAPYIDSLTSVDVVRDAGSRLVVDVRYLYRDRFKGAGDAGGGGCVGFAERRFTLARNDAGVQVVDMSGPGHR